MNNFKHLTEVQLSAYASGSLEKTESHEIGKHLLHCADCRRLLPMPSVERFWSIIMTEPETAGKSVKEKPGFSSISGFSAVFSFLKPQSGFVWSGAAIIVLLSISFLIWLNIPNSDREVAQTFDNEPGSGFSFPLPAPTLKDLNSSSSTNSSSSVTVPSPKKSRSDAQKQFPIQSKTRQSLEVKDPKQQKFTPTRGISDKCGEEKTIELEFFPDNENFVFKWRKIPNAAKYHLYISDDDEILIDEFETEQGTSFLLKKPLDPLKTYKWKIIVTLENGQTIVGQSQKFTVKDFRTDRMKVEKGKNSDNRCSANG